MKNISFQKKKKNNFYNINRNINNLVSNKNLSINHDKTYNIDEKHSEILKYFKNIDNVIIPDYIKEKDELIEKIKTLKHNQLEEYMNIKDRIKYINKEIKRLNSLKKNYYLDNSQYIFNYFEDKKNISLGNNNKNTELLNIFFKIKNSNNNDVILNNNNNYNQSKNLYYKYWKNVNNDIVNINDYVFQSDICNYCKIGELIPQDEDGILICNNNKCCHFTTYIVDNLKSNNKEPPNEVSYTAYIRLNHFKEILMQFQAKETTNIPDDVMKLIKDRIKKERIEDLTTLNYDKMREILRKLGLNKYFEHIQYINSIFGVKQPVISEELHETLCVLFIEIQKPWSIYCPPNRTNFFNYTYVFRQFCVLLDQTQFLPYITLLKDREKQLELDLIWKNICNDKDWYFFPTV